MANFGSVSVVTKIRHFLTVCIEQQLIAYRSCKKEHFMPSSLNATSWLYLKF